MGKRKRRTPQQVTGDVGVAYVDSLATRSGFTVERFQRDYGTDLNVYTYSEFGEIDNGEIRIQVRSTHRLNVLRDGATISVPVEVKHLHHWLSEVYPFLLIVFSEEDGEAYWLYIQRLFTMPQWKERLADAGRTINIHLSVKNKLDESAFLKFRQFLLRVLEQAWSVIDHGEDRAANTAPGS